jgi:tetratricopeptide (TPR) repeat protein
MTHAADPITFAPAGTGSGSGRVSPAATNAMLAALLALGTWAIYARSVSFDFIGFDDQVYLINNAHVNTGLSWANTRWALSSTSLANWHPVTWLTCQAVVQLAGVRPGAFHAASFLLHGGSAALMFVFLIRATGERWPSFAAAALFAWHPLRVESVAWVAEMKDCLSCFFWLATMLAYRWYVQRPGAARYLLVMAGFALALASKTTAVSLPCALVLLDYWPLRRMGDLRRNLLLIAEKLPLAAMSIAAARVNFVAQRAMHSDLLDSLTPLRVRIPNAIVSATTYLLDTLWPRGLCVFYPHPAMVGLSIPLAKVIVSAGVLLLISAVSVWRWRRWPFLIVGWLWFLGTLVPAIGLVQVGAQARADRYTYIPSIGLSVALVWLVRQLLAARERRQAGVLKAGTVAAAVTAAVAVAVAMIVATEKQLGTWRNNITLFTRANAVTQRNFVARSELSEAALARGDVPAALALAREAAFFSPMLPDPHRTLALALERADQDKAALHEWQLVVRDGGDEAITRDRIGSLLVKMNRNRDATVQFRRALAFDPGDAIALNNLGVLDANAGKMESAIAFWRAAIAASPAFGPAHGWLADALQRQGGPGDRVEAIVQFREAIAAGERRPQWLTALAWLEAVAPAGEGAPASPQQAIDDAMAACAAQVQPDPLSLDALAAALARAGQYDDAASTAARAAALARATGQGLLAKGIESRMMGYRAGRPYIAPAAASHRPGGPVGG